MTNSSKNSLTCTLFFPLFILLASMSLAPNSNAQVYKWTDKEGKVHYSDKPIDDKSKTLKMERKPNEKEIYQANKRARSIINHQQKLQEIAQDDANDNKIIADKAQIEERKRLAFCQSANRQIRRLGAGRTNYTNNEDGTRNYLSDENKNKMIDDYKSEMVKRCN